jgi:DNA (cytosine-5)-methyltransferase 1
MEHREIKTPEQIAELKELSPGGYRNLREVVINELPDSSLFMTPTAVEGEGGSVGERKKLELGHYVMLRDQVKDLAEDNLLPTPIVRDYKDGQAPSMRDGKVSVDTVGRAIMNSGEVNLLPTLRASDGYERRNQKTMDKIAAEGGDLTMPTLARTTVSWGKFTPAIERWEAVTRPAPAPTKPDGKDGNHRLSAEFTEWMMGLPAGWVTDPEMGLKRNDQLKACGNGVVPQQAELALRILLEDVNLEGM